MDNKTQDLLRQAYQTLADRNKDKTCVGKAGGDMVIATANMQMQLTKIDITPEAYQEDSNVLQGLIVAAVNDALMKAQQTMQQEMMAIAQQMGLNR